MIVYDPLHPRKNVSITLISNYKLFDEFKNFIERELNHQRIFPRTFEFYQK